MTTSGTSSFDLDLNTLVEEAFERCGAELRSGYDLRTARRSLNILTMEWANRGINLWTVDQGAIPLTQGQISYDLPADTVDLLDHVIRTGTGQGQTDINITRISVDTYANIPNKNAQGRPNQVWIDRQAGVVRPVTGLASPKINVWPTPDRDSYYTFVYWRLRRMQDAGDGIATQDVPFRFIPAMVAGLAYHLSWKIPGALERSASLKDDYETLFQQAADEDREKASLYIMPSIRY